MTDQSCGPGSERWAHWRFRNGREPLGPFGELVWKNVFIGSGLFYIPLADLPPINGKGPRLQGNDLILPDFHVSGRRNAYVDSKCKTKPVKFRIANELRHGVDFKCWESYSAIGALHRTKVLIAIVELFEADGATWSGTLLAQSLGVLGQPSRGIKSQSHMVYWPRNKFRPVARFSEAELWKLKTERGPAHAGVTLLKIMGPADTPEEQQGVLF